MKTDVKIPVGTPIMIAPMVTNIDPTIIGKIPKLEGLFDGAQFVPNKNFVTPYFAINGRPFAKIKKQIRSIATIAIAALRKNMALNRSSLKACLFTSCPF